MAADDNFSAPRNIIAILGAPPMDGDNRESQSWGHVERLWNDTATCHCFQVAVILKQSRKSASFFVARAMTHRRISSFSDTSFL